MLPNNRKNTKYSRSDYRRGHLDFAYVCGHCGNIRLGSPCVDPRDPPDPPVARCKVCRRVEWLESAIPAFDPSILDIDGPHNALSRLRAARFRDIPQPLPDYYSVDSLEPPRHARGTAVQKRKGFAPGHKPANHRPGTRPAFRQPEENRQ